MISMVNRICISDQPVNWPVRAGRRAGMAGDLRWNLAGGASLTAIAVVMLTTVWDYGLTWDE